MFEIVYIDLSHKCNVMATTNIRNVYPKVHIEYCGACDYGGHCLALANAIKKNTSNAEVILKRGRQGSFEVVINDRLIYSKLQTMALPDYEEIVKVVSDVSKGEEPREIKGQQPVNCVIS